MEPTVANLNKVMLIGNLTRDPEMTFTGNQTAVCNFGIAINRTWTAQDGTKKEEVTFVDCVAFAKGAETLAKYVKKGSPLFVEGRLKLDQWDDKATGVKRSKLNVIVEGFQFLASAPSGTGTKAHPQAPAQPSRASGRPAPAPEYDPAQQEAAGADAGQDIPFAPNLM
jgi:single-strand DNA-binding protein